MLTSPWTRSGVQYLTPGSQHMVRCENVFSLKRRVSNIVSARCKSRNLPGRVVIFLGLRGGSLAHGSRNSDLRSRNFSSRPQFAGLNISSLLELSHQRIWHSFGDGIRCWYFSLLPDPALDPGIDEEEGKWQWIWEWQQALWDFNVALSFRTSKKTHIDQWIKVLRFAESCVLLSPASGTGHQCPDLARLYHDACGFSACNGDRTGNPAALKHQWC